mmetsp:Transcript_32893/g.45898  ORF Transcript_32893/g.45898 Transcript_32893/m.45898 type:complete len:289 (+) Transcript_32893:998-1864(+)
MGEKLEKGQSVLYYSSSIGSWIQAVVERVRDDGTVDLDVKKQVDYRRIRANEMISATSLACAIRDGERQKSKLERDLQRLRKQISESRSEINLLRRELEMLRSERADTLRMRIGKTGSSSETLIDKESMSSKATLATNNSSADSKRFHHIINWDLAQLLNELKQNSKLSRLSESLRNTRKIIEGIVDFYQRGVNESENLKKKKMNEFRVGLMKLKDEIFALQCAEDNFPVVSVVLALLRPLKPFLQDRKNIGIACIVGFRMNIVNCLFVFSLALVVRWVCLDWINRLW